MKKRAVIGLVASILLICLLSIGIMEVVRDEPPPDTSDLDMIFVPMEKGSFSDRIMKGELDLPDKINVDIESIVADSQERNAHLSPHEVHKLWDTGKIDGHLARIPQDFWVNIDSIVQAPVSKNLEYNSSVFTEIRAARVVRYKALRLTQTGDPEAGLRLAAKIPLLGRKAGEVYGNSINFIGGSAIRRIGYDTIGEIAGNYQVSSECLREIRNTIEQSRFSNDAVRDAIKSDYCHVRHYYIDPFLSSAANLKHLFATDGPSGSFTSIPYGMDICPEAILLKPNETLRVYAGWTRETLKWADYNSKELSELAQLDVDEEATRYSKGRFPYDPRNAGGRAILRCMATDDFQSILRSRLVAESRASALEAMLAAREYELKYGAPPNSLEELVPEYLPGVPVDFMDDLPIRYSQEARMAWTIGRRHDLIGPLRYPDDEDERGLDIFRLPPVSK
ncbi:MAG: hypothetical protein LBV12_11605 [Puniceicoccales bacterium]|jgi:hypothetical protein|nr:hypothetical protein [Puniceicoccales bacterium]